MKRLIKTSRFGTAGHYHWVYFDDDDVSGTSIKVSTAKGHTHPASVQMIPGMMNELEQLGQQQPQMQQKLDPSLIIIGDAGDTSHSHILTEEEILPSDSVKLEIPQLENKEITSVTKTLVSSAFTREEPSKQRGHISEQFCKVSNQWINPDGTPIEVDTSKQMKLTINLIQAFMNLLFGNHRQNRTDWKFLPVESSDQLIADVYTAVAKIEQTKNLAEFNENQVVEDQGITGRGSFVCYADFDKNIEGDIKIKRVPWRNVYFGEHEGLAGEDAEYVFTTTYLSKAEVIARFNEDDVNDFSPGLNSIAETQERAMKNDTSVAVSGVIAPLKDAYDIEKKEFRIVDLWKKEYAKIYSIINQEDGFFATSDKKFSDLKQFESLGFKQIQRKKEYVRHQTFASESLILVDEISEIDMLPIVPVYYSKCGDYFFGKVELTLDLQRFYNKLFSKMMDFVIKSVNDIILYDKNSIPQHGTMNEEKTFRDDLTTPSTAIEVEDVESHLPVRFPNSQLPPYLFNLLKEITSIMQTVLNLNPAFLGQSTAESGIKVMQNKQQALMGNECWFDNLALSKKHLGLLFLKVAKQVYTVDRIMRIMENNDYTSQEFHFGGINPETGEENIVSGRKFTDEENAEIEKRLKSADTENLDVAVAQAPYNPTTMLANYSIIMEAYNSGRFPVPPEYIIELNPTMTYKDKQKGLAYIKQEREREMQLKQQEQQSQERRTAEAAQAKMATEQMKLQSRNNPAATGY